MSTGEPPPGPAEGPAQFAHVLPALEAYQRHLDPGSAAKDRMRARLLAEFPDAVRQEPPRPDPAARRRRFAVALAACLALIGSLSGMSVLLSRDAVPGETLYAVKRGAETAELGLIFGEHPRALKHLEFAHGRVGELDELLDRPEAAQADFARALGDLDADAAAGSRLLTELGADSDETAFATLAEWATAVTARLRAAGVALPPAARQRLERTLELLERIRQRAGELRARAGCLSTTSGAADDIGALPATDRCMPAPAREVSALPTQGTPGREPVTSPTSAPSATPAPARSTGPSAVRTSEAPIPVPLPEPSEPQVSAPPPVPSTPPPAGLLPGLLDLLKLPFGPLGPNG